MPSNRRVFSATIAVTGGSLKLQSAAPSPGTPDAVGVAAGMPEEAAEVGAGDVMEAAPAPLPLVGPHYDADSPLSPFGY